MDATLTHYGRRSGRKDELLHDVAKKNGGFSGYALRPASRCCGKDDISVTIWGYCYYQQCNWSTQPQQFVTELKWKYFLSSAHFKPYSDHLSGTVRTHAFRYITVSRSGRDVRLHCKIEHSQNESHMWLRLHVLSFWAFFTKRKKDP